MSNGTDLATLGIQVDATQVTAGATKLDDLKKAGTGAERATDLLRKGVIALGAAFTAAKVLGFISEITQLAIQNEKLGIAMRVAGNNAGFTIGQIATFEKQVQAASFTMNESRDIIAKLAIANVDLSKAQALAIASQNIAVASGRDAREVLESLKDTIISGREVTIKMLGLNVDFDLSYKTLAASIGKTTSQLTESQRLQARTTAIIEAATSAQGLFEEALASTSTQTSELEEDWENLRTEMGKLFLPATAASVKFLRDAIADLNSSSKMLNDTLDYMEERTRAAFWFLLNPLPSLFKLPTVKTDDSAALEQQTRDLEDYQASIEGARIRNGVLAREKREQAELEAQANKIATEALKEATKETESFIDTLEHEINTLVKSARAIKEYELSVAIAKAPTKELAAEVQNLGDQLLFALANDAINEAAKEKDRKSTRL